jgi:hypothetical protein
MAGRGREEEGTRRRGKRAKRKMEEETEGKVPEERRDGR